MKYTYMYVYNNIFILVFLLKPYFSTFSKYFQLVQITLLYSFLLHRLNIFNLSIFIYLFIIYFTQSRSLSFLDELPILHYITPVSSLVLNIYI